MRRGKEKRREIKGVIREIITKGEKRRTKLKKKTKLNIVKSAMGMEVSYVS